MDAIIKIKLSELNTAFIERVKTLFQDNEDVELTMKFEDKQQRYFEVLNRSKNDLENRNNLVTFSMEELEEYAKAKKA